MMGKLSLTPDLDRYSVNLINLINFFINGTTTELNNTNSRDFII